MFVPSVIAKLDSRESLPVRKVVTGRSSLFWGGKGLKSGWQA
jgi:hypothetical protein